MSNGKYESGKYHTIAATRNKSIKINEERVRLGIKAKNAKGVEYPVETDYFVCPKRIREMFGEEPTELTVFFPLANREMVFPQAYEKYGKNKAMQCQGDGEVSAQKKDQETGEWKTVKCPCEHLGKACKKVGYLKFMIPSVSIGTFFQCAVHGTVSINECNSGFFTADQTTGGRWAMLPFQMKRVPKKIKIPGSAKMKTHWVVTLEVIAGIEEIRRVMAGEILYLGQLKAGKQYQLESSGPQEGNAPEVKEETKEEKAARKEKAEEARIAEETYQKESKDREAKLKEEVQSGEHDLKDKEARQEIAEKKEALKVEIEKLAKKYNYKDWAELIDMGARRGIFNAGITTSQAARTFLFDHPDKCKVFKELMKTDQEIATGDIPF